MAGTISSSPLQTETTSAILSKVAACGELCQVARATEGATTLPLRRLVEIVSNYERPILLLLPRLHSLLCFIQRSFPFFAGVLHALLLRKDSVGNLEVTMRWAMEAGHIAEVTTLFRWAFADWAKEGHLR
jgi:hypothetical protein